MLTGFGKLCTAVLAAFLCVTVAAALSRCARGEVPALAVPAAAAEQVSPQRTYVVQPGDTLGAIAAAFGLASWRPLFEANRATIADPDLILPGWVLTIPGAVAAPDPAPSAPIAAGPATNKGDGSIEDIIVAAAWRYGQSPAAMLRVARCESRLDPNAVGRAGERGLFQFLPSTWRGTPYAGYSAFDPWANANAAAWAWATGYRWWWSCQ